MKEVLKNLVIITWWELRLYAKRLKYTIYYGINYREQLHTWYNHIQEIRNCSNCLA